MEHKIKRVFAFLLSVLMLMSTVPFSASAAESIGDGYYSIISETNWDIAPGIAETEYILNNDAGSRRQVVHVMEVDLSNPSASILPSYMGMNPTHGNFQLGTMSKQAAWVEENMGLNVVGAMNTSLSWYDSDYYVQNPDMVGEPTGLLIINGTTYSQKTSSITCLVINYDTKDGQSRPAEIPKVELRYCEEALTGWEEQAIPCNFDFLVKDGVNMTAVSHSSQGAKSIVGVKADGTVVILQTDGRLEPFSDGMNNYEVGEILLELGCVDAIRCDGGGTSTYLSQRPGEELKVNNTPSDGAERETTTGILVISSAVSDNVFARASITADNHYYAPGSQVTFTATGTDIAGTPVEIPSDVVWQIQESGMGTIADGVFTSNGTSGKATVQLLYNGSVVGSCVIEIVAPEAFTGTDFLVTADKKLMYFINGDSVTGYQYLNGSGYFFDESGYGLDGTYEMAGETCQFTKGRFVSCSSAEVLSAGMIGPDATYVVYANKVARSGGVTLKIAGTGDTYDFSNHGSRPYAAIDWQITRLEVAKGITSIGDGLLMNTGVAEVVFEEGSELRRIGKRAFKQCYSLKEIELPDKVETLDKEAFGRSANLEKIVLPASVKSIDASAFSELKNVTLQVEKDSYAEQFAVENQIPYVIAPAEVKSVPMHRMYDPNSGEHFYSGSELERDFLVEAGWHYEGVGFNFPEEGAPVHRLYDPVHGEHLYTMDEAEKNKLLDEGWQYEGVAFNSAGNDEVPQYRLNNPNAKRGGYHFTGSDVERDFLISLGWIPQGIGWYSCLE